MDYFLSVVMVTVTLLGTAQDGGRPQPGCQRACCQNLGPNDQRYPVSLGIQDTEGGGHLVEATRFLGQQLALWKFPPLRSVSITHAHFGHVDGLGLFGKETMNASSLPLHLSSAMFHLLEETPAWAVMLDDGVFEEHIFLHQDHVQLGPGLVLEPINVPHRAELSDMHAFIVRGPRRSLLFLPDHDSWNETLQMHHATTIRAWLSALEVDIALIDGTFWSMNELEGRTQSEVPHPPVKETLKRLGTRQPNDPEIHFIHLNHTNPLHDQESDESREVIGMGWGVAEQGQSFNL